MNASPNAHDILQRLSTLPQKILRLHHTAHLPDFLLHEIAKDCFNLPRAAYLVDNPDFNCLQGISGFRTDESYQTDSIWQDPDNFIAHTAQSSYNQRVKRYSRCSLNKASTLDDQTLHAVAGDLEFNNPSFHHFNLKHDNHGIFIFERNNQCKLPDEYLYNSLYYFSFCPIH